MIHRKISPATPRTSSRSTITESYVKAQCMHCLDPACARACMIGALSHWVVIEDGKIKNYQCVVPSTWNAGPRDEKDRKGPYEASLIDNPIADPEKPLEVLRTIHSFDPCLACAIHTLDVDGRELSKVQTLV